MDVRYKSKWPLRFSNAFLSKVTVSLREDGNVIKSFKTTFP